MPVKFDFITGRELTRLRNLLVKVINANGIQTSKEISVYDLYRALDFTT